MSGGTLVMVPRKFAFFVLSVSESRSYKSGKFSTPECFETNEQERSRIALRERRNRGVCQ